MADIFISYSRRDSDFVTQLEKRLIASDLEIWRDHKIRTGSVWMQEIEDAIDQAKVVVFVISPDALISPVCTQEITYTRSHNKRIVPLLYRQVEVENQRDTLLPEVLNEWFQGGEWGDAARDNWRYLKSIDYPLFIDPAQFDRAYQKLLSAIQTDFDYVDAHTRYENRASEWHINNRQPEFLLRGTDLVAAEAWRLESEGKEPKRTGLQDEYILTSVALRQHEEAERQEQRARELALRERASQRLRWLLTVFAGSFVVALVLSILAFSQARRADNNAATSEANRLLADSNAATSESNAATAVYAENQAIYQADISQSVALAAQSQLELQNSRRRERSVLLALEALENYPYTWQAERALAQAISQNRVLSTLESPFGFPLIYADWSSDDLQINLTDMRGTAQQWDANTSILMSSRLATLTDSNGVQLSALMWYRFSPDGNYAATLGLDPYDDVLATIWNVRQGTILFNIPDVVDIAWTPEGKLITATDEGVLKFHDLTGTTPKTVTLEQTDDFIFQTRLTPDGLYAVTLSGSAIMVWETITGQEVVTLGYNGEGIFGIGTFVVSPDGAHLAGEIEGQGYIWDFESGRIEKVLDGEGEGGISHLAWSPDSQWLAGGIDPYANYDRSSILSDTIFGPVVPLPNPEYPVLVWQREGLVYDPVLELKGHASTVYTVAWSQDGQELLSASTDGTAIIWATYDLAASQRSTLNDESFTTITDVEWSPDGAHFFTINEEGTFTHFDANTFESLWTLRLEVSSTDDLTPEVAISPDGTRVAIARGQALTEIWELQTRGLLYQLEDYRGVVSVNWSPDGTRLLTTTREGSTADVWDAQDGSHLLKVGGEYQAGMPSAAWSPDSRRFVTVESGGQITIWDAASGDKVLAFLGHRDVILNVTWSPDGKYLLTTSADGTAKIWDADTGTEEHALIGHVGVITVGIWSPDAKRVATTGIDKTVRLWDATNGAELNRLTGHTNALPYGLAWSPDGRAIALADIDGTARFWTIYPDTASLITAANKCCVRRSLTLEERSELGLPEIASAYVKAGNADLLAGRYENAADSFNRAIEIDATLISAYLGRGKTYFELALDDLSYEQKAIDDFSQAITLDPSFADAYKERARVYYYQAEYELAMEDISRSIQLVPTDAESYVMRGDITFELDLRGQTLADYSQAINLAPTNIAYLTKRASFNTQIQDYATALVDRNRILELSPSAVAFYNRAMTHHNLGQYAEALNDCNTALRLNPNYGDALALRGDLYFFTGNYDRAATDYRRLREINPNYFFDYQINEAMAEAWVGNMDYALALMDDFIEVDPEDSQGWYWRSLLHILNDDPAAFATDMEQAVVLSADDGITESVATLWRAAVAMRAGKANEAEAELQTAAALIEAMPDEFNNSQWRFMALKAMLEDDPEMAQTYYGQSLEQGSFAHQWFAPIIYLRILAVMFPEDSNYPAVSQWLQNQFSNIGLVLREESRVIAVGQTVTGDLPRGSAEQWQFEGARGDVIVAELHSDEFDTYLELLDPDGLPIASNDDLEGSDSGITYELDRAGNYALVVHSYSVGQGTYTLTFLTKAAITLVYGQSQEGALRDGFPDEWYFEGQVSDIVTISLTTSLSPQLQVLNPEGTDVTPEDEDSTNNVKLQLRLIQNGTYTIRLRDRNSDISEYQLALTELDLTPQGILVYGDSIEERLDVGTYDRWEFEGRIGDEVIINMTSADVDPYLELYSGIGEKLVENDDVGFDRSAEIRFTLPESGPYIILVRSALDEASGGYSLTLERVELEITGTLTYGKTVNGTVPSITLDDLNRYTFEGNLGDVVDIELSSSIFNTQLVLIGPDRNVIAINYDFRLTNSRISAKLPSSGTYTIEVKKTTILGGDYSLSLTQGTALEPGPLTYSDTVNAIKLQTGGADLWTFEGIAGEAVTIGVLSYFDSQVELIGPDGASLTTDYAYFVDETGALADAYIEAFKLPVTGTYSVSVTSFSQTSGLYTLYVDRQETVEEGIARVITEYDPVVLTIDGYPLSQWTVFDPVQTFGAASPILAQGDLGLYLIYSTSTSNVEVVQSKSDYATLTDWWTAIGQILWRGNGIETYAVSEINGVEIWTFTVENLRNAGISGVYNTFVVNDMFVVIFSAKPDEVTLFTEKLLDATAQ